LSYAPGPFVCIDWWEVKRAGLFGTFNKLTSARDSFPHA